MVRRKSGGFLEDLATVTAKAPWWVGVLLAAGSYLALHAAAQIAGFRLVGGIGRGRPVSANRRH